MQICAVVNAAGLSRRTGNFNKLMQRVSDRPIIVETVGNLVDSKVDRIVVVTGHEHERIEQVLQPFSSIGVVPNAKYEHGLTSSIQAGVGELNADEAMMICMGDMPFVRSQDYDFLISAFFNASVDDHATILRPYRDTLPGNPVIFASAYRESILNHDEPDGCSGIIQHNQSNLVKLETDREGFFVDIDTLDDLERLKRIN